MITAMASEERLSGSYGEMEEQNERIECATYNIPGTSVKGRVNMLLFQGSSVYDAWFSASSNQVKLWSSSSTLKAAIEISAKN